MRTPLQVPSLTALLSRPWRDVRLVPETASTNADLVRAANAGTSTPWSVLIAEHQSAGRGRLGRSWTTAPGTALTCSALVPTPREPGWVPLITGLAVAGAIEELYAVRPALKWPNDVLGPVGSAVDGLKIAGILCEQTGAGVVVGTGINVDQEERELPVPTATSLRLLAQGRHPDGVTREIIAATVLNHLSDLIIAWGSGPDRVRDAYRSSCVTLGRDVLVDLGQAGVQAARAVAIDDSGQLVIANTTGRRTVAAGDVTHVRDDNP